MNIFHNFVSIFGGPGETHILNPEVLKCHEDLITLETDVQQGKTMENKFFIYVKTSLAIWGPGGGGGGVQ